MPPTFPFDHAHTQNPAPGRRSPSIERWEDEGGPPMPQRSAPPAKPARSMRSLSHERRDTAAGCRERAAADLLESATLATVKGRQRMESSAASWTERAELLDRLEASLAARQSAVQESPDDDEAPLRS